MTCSDCGKHTYGQPIITLYAEIDGEEDRRFTGVIFCRACAPAHKNHLADDLEFVARSINAPASVERSETAPEEARGGSAATAADTRETTNTRGAQA